MFNSLFHNILSIIKPINKAADFICKSDDKIHSSKMEQELDDKRNKTFVLAHFILDVVFVVDAMLDPTRFMSNVFRIILTLSCYTVIYISGRTSKHFFKTFYLLVCYTYSMGVIQTGAEGIYIAMLSVHMLPLFVYVITGGFYYFLAQVIIQTWILNLDFPSILNETITYVSPSDFTKFFVYASNFTTIFFVVLVFITYISQQQAFLRLEASEQRNTEIEAQKTCLMSFSHELRNLINGLIGNVQLISIRTIDERTRELVSNAQVCGDLLLYLVNNILDTGKVEVGELEINPVEESVYNMLEKIWGVCSELIKRKGLRGSIRIQKNIPKILMIDHYRLSQIILNLVGNAIKFTENGSIEMTVQWISNKIVVNDKCFDPVPYNEDDDQDEGLFEKSQNFDCMNEGSILMNNQIRKINRNNLKEARRVERGILKVVVKDTGVGMNKEQIEQLFQKFTQVTTDANKRKLGTGLGLFISKQLCKRMNGEIKAYGKKEKGSTFIFCIPVDCPQPSIG